MGSTDSSSTSASTSVRQAMRMFTPSAASSGPCPHTSPITGGQPARHGGIANAVWSRKLDRSLVYIGDPELTKEEAIKVPTLYDAAHRAGLKCCSVIWPCSSGADTLNWVIPDSGKPELHARYTTPGFIEQLGKAGIDISQLGAWGWSKERSTERDILYTVISVIVLAILTFSLIHGS